MYIDVALNGCYDHGTAGMQCYIAYVCSTCSFNCSTCTCIYMYITCICVKLYWLNHVTAEWSYHTCLFIIPATIC